MPLSSGTVITAKKKCIRDLTKWRKTPEQAGDLSEKTRKR